MKQIEKKKIPQWLNKAIFIFTCTISYIEDLKLQRILAGISGKYRKIIQYSSISKTTIFAECNINKNTILEISYQIKNKMCGNIFFKCYLHLSLKKNVGKNRKA